MRTAFIGELLLQARQNPRLFLVVADLGFSVVETFATELPNQYLNVGVAEQNMTGVAAGLAAEGYHVFTYSIANFTTLRCLEQIRNDVAYHNLPVTVVSVGAGLAYGNLGYSHHAIQDVACLRGFPNMTILGPSDPGDARQCVRYLTANPGPSYLRLGKAGEKELHPEFPVTRRPQLVAGTGSEERAVVATGSILSEALSAAATASEPYAVYSLVWLAPLAKTDLTDLWRHKRLIFIEEHVEAGGIGESVASMAPDSIKITRLSVDSLAVSFVGSQSNLRHAHGLSQERIVRACAD